MNAHRSRPWLVAASIALAFIGGCSQANGSDDLASEAASSPHPASGANAGDQDTGGAAEAASNGDTDAPTDSGPPTEPPGESPGPSGPSERIVDPDGCAVHWQQLVEAGQLVELRSELLCVFDSPTATPDELAFAQELDERARDELLLLADDPDLVVSTDPLVIAPDDTEEP